MASLIIAGIGGFIALGGFVIFSRAEGLPGFFQQIGTMGFGLIVMFVALLCYFAEHLNLGWK